MLPCIPHMMLIMTAGSLKWNFLFGTLIMESNWRTIVGNQSLTSVCVSTQLHKHFRVLSFHITLVKMDSNTIFNLEDFRLFQKVGNDKRILDSGKKLNLGEGILHKCKFHGKLCTCYFFNPSRKFDAPVSKFSFLPESRIFFIISHLLEWSKVRQIKNGIRVHFDQCERAKFNRLW